MDVEMPKKNGIQACNEIRKFWEKREIRINPVIIIATAGGSDDEDVLLRSNANELKFKPIGIKELIKTFNQYEK